MAILLRNRIRIASLVRTRKEFKIGNVSAKWHNSDNPPSFGRLPTDHREAIQKVLNSGIAIFVVYSWQTPIAWTNPYKWCIPDVNYSVSTTHHQHLLRVITETDLYTSDK